MTSLFFSAAMRRAMGFGCLASAALLANANHAAFAQWSQSETLTPVKAYNDAFYFNPGGDDYDYRYQQGSIKPLGFWESAEAIEMAEDAYANNPTTEMSRIVAQLCNGFIARYTADWSSDTWDDDLMWATIAFSRAYEITHNTAWLHAATSNFTTVWSRGYDTTYGGGIWENVKFANTPEGYKASAANWTFVIAGNLLSRQTGDATYRTEARTVYAWAFKTLFNQSSGEVYDGFGAKKNGLNPSQFSYNYGSFVGAAGFAGDAAQASLAAAYLANFKSSGTTGGYNIMPVYSGRNNDGYGFDGIALRWIGAALRNGVIRSDLVQKWALANVTHAWSLRNSAGFSWKNWTKQTPDGAALTSWGCIDTVVGMLDVPQQSHR